jgi:hypothetical protein
MIRTKEYQRFQNKLFNILFSILNKDVNINSKTISMFNCFDIGLMFKKKYQNVKTACILKNDILIACHLTKEMVVYYTELADTCLFHVDKWNISDVLVNCETFFKKVDIVKMDKENSILICKNY